MPLFIRRVQGGFHYFVTYTEPRYSNRIGANEMMREVLDSIRNNIPAIKDTWPKIEVSWWDEDLKKFADYDPELGAEYGKALKCPILDEETEAVTEKNILKAFNATLFYEYLQAVGYDHDFYRILIEKKSDLGRLGAF